MELLNKKKSHAFGKDIYFLGRDAEGINYWLEAGSWDCDWYWGFGYVETYTRNNSPETSRDIQSHQHFDGLFFNKNKNGYDAFKEFFVGSPLTEKELWQLLELMKTIYTMKEYAEVVHRGGSHYTNNVCKDILKSETEYNRINKEVMPAVMQEVYKLLTPTD